MALAEHRDALAAQLGQLEDLLRQAQAASRGLEERAAVAAGDTESFADDTALAQVGAVARRSRQELGALLRAVATARGQIGGR